MIYRIADFYIEIEPMFESTERFLEPFLCEDAPRIDFTATVVRDDLVQERDMAHEIEGDVERAKGNYERLAMLRKVSAECLKHNSFLMHGALIEYRGKGYIFGAKSGTGKTTHILNWLKKFGEDNVRVINGDKPIIRFIDGKFYGYGTPWCGKEGLYTDARCEINSICFIKRAEDNSIREIGVDMALARIFTQIMVADSTNLAAQLELTGRFLESAELYELSCNMDIQSANVAFNGMNKN